LLDLAMGFKRFSCRHFGFSGAMTASGMDAAPQNL